MNEQTQAIIHFLSTSTAALGPETHLVLEAISSKPALEISEFTPSSLVEENTGKANDLCQQPATSSTGRSMGKSRGKFYGQPRSRIRLLSDGGSPTR